TESVRVLAITLPLSLGILSAVAERLEPLCQAPDRLAGQYFQVIPGALSLQLSRTARQTIEDAKMLWKYEMLLRFLCWNRFWLFLLLAIPLTGATLPMRSNASGAQPAVRVERIEYHGWTGAYRLSNKTV